MSGREPASRHLAWLQERRPVSHSALPLLAQSCLVQKWGCLQHLQAKGCGARKTAVQGGVTGNSNQGKLGWSASTTLGGVSQYTALYSIFKSLE